MLDQILSTAEDIIVLGKSGEDKVVFAFPFEREIAKNYYKKTIADTKENNVKGFNRHWKFDDKTGLIKGSNTFLVLKLDEQIRKDGLWIPTPEQAMLLDKKGKLSNNVYRDYGMAVYSEAQPNQEIAKEIISQTKRKLPLVIPFKDLTHRLDENFPYGVAITLIDKPKEVIFGEEARQYLDKEFDYKMDSGVCRLYRYGDGDWDADWDRFDNSNADGRVDFVCGEATRADLKEAYKGLLEGQYNIQINKLTTERDERQAEFKKSLKI